MGPRHVPTPPEEAAAATARLVPTDETGPCLNPTVRRSWAPVGRTPVTAVDRGHRKELAVTVDLTKMSVTVDLTMLPPVNRRGDYFATAADGYVPTDKVVAFVWDLPLHLTGRAMVIGDDSGIHRGPPLLPLLRQ